MGALATSLDCDGAVILPPTYIAARIALAKCDRVDECQEWASKATALSSYAKQAKDDALQVLADRIRARAVRRCGELLQQSDSKSRKDKEQKMISHRMEWQKR